VIDGETVVPMDARTRFETTEDSDDLGMFGFPQDELCDMSVEVVVSD
jgi:hypothetical protein